MKHLKVGLVAIVAFVAMSFTLISRSGNVMEEPYAPTGDCWEQFIYSTQTYGPSDVQFITSPSQGLVAATNVEMRVGGADLNTLSPVTAAGKKVTLCDDNLDVVCCFKIESSAITGVYTGTKLAVEN